MEQDLDAKIRELEKQLEGLSDDEQPQLKMNNRISQDLEELQKQLAGVSDDQDNTPPPKKTKIKADAQFQQMNIDHLLPPPIQQVVIPQVKIREPTMTKRQSKNKVVEKQIVVLPSIDDVKTLVAMQQLIQLAIKQNDTNYLSEMVNRKQKYMNLIQSGKINSDFYVKGLQNNNPSTIKNPLLSAEVSKQQKILQKINNNQQFFQRIVSKCKETLSKHMQKAGIQDPKNRQFKPTVVFQPKSAQVNKQQMQLIEGVNKAAPQKKLQLLMQGMAKMQSLIEYYKEHIPEKKKKQLETVLLPKREYGLQLVKALQAKKNIPIGQFFVLDLPKITSDVFHGFPRKQYMASVGLIIDKVKTLQSGEKQFRKLIYKSSKNSVLLEKIDKQLAIYEEDLKYLNDIKGKQFYPVPTIKIFAQQRQYFNENTKLDHNDLQLIIRQADGFESAELKVYFEQSDNPRTVYHVTPGPQKIDLILKVTQETQKDLSNKSIRLKMQTKKMLMFTTDLMNASINLSQLETKNSFDGILITNKIKIAYQINVRAPMNKLCKSKVEVIRIKRSPQYQHTKEFQIDFIRKILYPNTKKPASQPPTKPVEQPQTKPVQQKIQSQPPPSTKLKLSWVERTEQIVQKLKTAIPGIPPEMIQKPEMFSDSLKYITQYDPILDKAASQIYGYKPNRRIIENIQDQIMKRKMVIENSVSKGKLDPAGYAKLLEKNIINDQSLLKAFASLELPQFVVFIQTRIKILQAELKQMKGEQQQPKPEVKTQSKAPQQTKQPSEPQKQKVVPLPENSEGMSLAPYKLFFVKRTPQILQILNSLTQPIDFVEVDKIKKPQLVSFSVKYLTAFETVLDSSISEFSGTDKSNRVLAENTQDQIMKLKIVSGKKKQTMSPQQYNQVIRNYIDTDLKLRRVYQSLKLPQFQKFILSRIKVYKEQIGQPPYVEIQKPLSFNPNEAVQIFQLKPSQAALNALSKYPLAIQYPQLSECCPCLSYVQKMCQLSTNPQAKQKFQAWKQQFQKGFAEGTFNQDDYVQKLKKTKQQDIVRLEVYRKLDLKQYYLFIKARIKIIEEELVNFQ